MPIYQYEPTVYAENQEVTSCCYFDSVQSREDPPHTHCPQCGHLIHRSFGTFGVQSKRSSSPAKSRVSTRENVIIPQEIRTKMTDFLTNATGSQAPVDLFSPLANSTTLSKETTSSQKAGKLIAQHVCHSRCLH